MYLESIFLKRKSKQQQQQHEETDADVVMNKE